MSVILQRTSPNTITITGDANTVTLALDLIRQWSTSDNADKDSDLRQALGILRGKIELKEL